MSRQYLEIGIELNFQNFSERFLRKSDPEKLQSLFLEIPPKVQVTAVNALSKDTLYRIKYVYEFARSIIYVKFKRCTYIYLATTYEES